MRNETEADGMPSYLQPDKETDFDNELNLPPVPTGRTGAPPGQVQVKFLNLFSLSFYTLSFSLKKKKLKCFKV